jgi:hypothetical protein
LPITLANIEFIMLDAQYTFSHAVKEHSLQAGITIIGFHEDLFISDPIKYFSEFQPVGDILFVHSSSPKEIT